MHHHLPVLCIIPPHMLHEIVRNGSPEQREMAVRTLITSEQIRGQRRALRELKGLMGAAVGSGKKRTVYSAQNGSQLPGVKVRGEGDPPSADVAINEAYDGSGLTYDLYFDIYGRNSIDNNGMQLDSTVHFQKGYDNAFWNGQQMVYGDGDEDLPANQRLFNRFTICLDIIAHELTHGVTEHEANLAYFTQSGALNESMSDVFGSLVKQFQRGQTAAQADWIVGEGLFTANVNGVGIRSMKAPGTAYDDPVLGKDPQPAHMKDYVNTIEDNGGVHINSGIPNRAFYVTALEIGGNAWEKAGRIWYKTLTDKLQSTANFQNAADLTFEAAGEIYGVGGLEQLAVKKGWSEVGITVGGSTGGEGCLNAFLKIFGLQLRSR
jgi:Zn-dependent metalloprotease